VNQKASRPVQGREAETTSAVPPRFATPFRRDALSKYGVPRTRYLAPL